MKIETLEQLAGICSDSATETSIRSSKMVVGSDGVTITGIRAERLQLSGILARGAVRFEHCLIGWLEITSSKFASGFSLSDCDVGSFEMKAITTRGGIAVLRSQLKRALFHDVPKLSISHVSIATDLVLSSPSSSVHLLGTQCERIRFTNDLIHPLKEMRINDCSIGDDVSMAGVRAQTVSIDQLRSKSLLFEGAGSIEITRANIDFGMQIVALPGTDSLILDGQAGDLTVEIQSEIEAAYSMRIGGDVFLSGPGTLRIGGGRVLGTLHQDYDNPGVVALTRAAEISRVNPPTTPIRRCRQVEPTVSQFFEAPSVREFRLVWSALKDRPQEQDLVYFVQRQRIEAPRWSIRRLLHGSVLGWGVRIWPPVRAVLLFVALLASLIHLSGFVALSGDLWSPRDAIRAVVVTLQLMVNVSSNTSGGAEGIWWNTVSVLASLFGLVFTTLILGIVIRRLVR